jgi:pyruvate kinase
VQVAHTIGAVAIVALTASGATALRVARERPDCPVLGLTTSLTVARRLALVWGVHAALTGEVRSMTEAVASAAKLARMDGFAQKGDEIVVVAGVPFGQPGTTNALRVARI